jgi:hydroxyacylglutathione hydrolase
VTPETLDSFTGGVFDTNCFFLPQAGILVDAPQDAAEWLKTRGHKVELLLLTHGHIDHVWDAARIQKEHSCAVGFHPETEPMVTRRDFFKEYGYGWEIEPVTGGFYVEETPGTLLQGIDFQVLYVPGHSPGHLCFFWKEKQILFGGDVLFSSGVGRWDLPGGDMDLLFRGIREKVFTLGDDVVVLPGHGPATRIGIERRNNPYVAE